VGGEDAEVLATSGFVLGYFGEDIEAAISLIDRSLELNPSYARGWIRSGWVRLWAGRPDLAIEHFQTAMRLNPRELTPHNLLAIGVAYFFIRDFEQAKAMLLRSLEEEPKLGAYPSLPGCVLRADGAARRGARGRRAAARHHPCRHAKGYSLSKPGAPRPVPFMSAPCVRRNDMSQQLTVTRNRASH
jgi:tetratricopeptide (TPR) repeat protein